MRQLSTEKEPAMPAHTTAASPSTTRRSRVAALLATLLVACAVSLTPAGAQSTASAVAAATSENVSGAQMSGGGNAHCTVRTDHTLWCWGWNFTVDSIEGPFFSPGLFVSPGLIGSGGKNEPQQVGTNLWLSVDVGPNTISGIVIVTATDTHGALYCFGANSSGQLGTEPSILRDSVQPRQLGQATNWATVAVGSNHLCAISTASELWCIGANSFGQLGLGSGDTTDRSTLVYTNNSANAVVAGSMHTCFLAANIAYCMGANDSGQLGIGETGVQSDEFVVVAGSHTFSSLTAGENFTCGVAINSTSFSSDAGLVYCWGSNWAGQTGTSNADSVHATPVQITTGETFTSVQAGANHACGLTTSKKVYCWGTNYSGESGEASSVQYSLPHQVGSATNWAEVAVADLSSCARTAATASVPSATYCWGWRQNIGTGTPSYFNVPMKLPGTGWLRVATNGGTRCAIQGTALPGKLFCSGSNWSGQAGNNTTDEVRTPVELPMVGGWGEVAIGERSTCAITGAGALYCWGINYYGQLGVGDTSSRNVPTKVGSDTGWSGISVGGDTACAFKGATEVYCWGSDDSGQVGNGDAINVDQSSPSLVDFSGTGAHVWRKVSVGPSHVCALDTAQQLYCWGDNGDGIYGGSGMLGDGSSTNRTFPVRSVPGMQFIDASAGAADTCGVAVGGATWCWGQNLYGSLGNGNSLPDFLFFFGGVNSAFAGGSATQVESGWWANCSIKRGGDLYCWGLAFAGNLPLGRDESSPVPTKVGSGFVSVELPTGEFNNGGCGIKSDTSLWCWGWNQANSFQNGALDTFSTPQLIKVLYRKPVADGAAQFTGLAKKNSVLTADAPDFSGTPIPAVTYQWYRCTKAAGASTSSVPSTCTKITSATASSYTLKTADVNKYVRLLITAKNKGGTVTIFTASSAKVAN
jgi:alpha-tubulin suppressor-like RCC1 family protein